jgi:hypothetical protein
VLRRSPDEFWRMTIPELVTGADGALMLEGVDPDKGKHITGAEIAAIEDECRRQGLI